MNRYLTGKLESYSNTTFCLYFLKESVLAYFQSLFRKSNRDEIWENEGKYMNGMYERVFSVKFQVGVSQFLYELT